MFQSKKGTFFLLLSVAFLLCCCSLFIKKPALSVFGIRSATSSPQPPTILLDAGHGGRDPGKVSVQGVLEKDINLAIVMKIKQLLANHPVNVILTRKEDKDLSTTDTNYKNSDLDNRIRLIQEASPVLAVSIHQNSYPDADVYGAQCFYPTESEAGKNLASIIQNQIITAYLADMNKYTENTESVKNNKIYK